MKFTKTVFSSVIGLVLATVQVVDAVEQCNEASGVLGGFPRALCLYDTPVGEVGGPVNINVAATTVNVPENPGGTDDVDVFVLLANEITAPPAMQYTTTFSWPDPVDPGSLIFREWVGNFNFDPPRATALTYVNAPDPANEILPTEFSWVLDDNQLAIGAKVEDRGVTGLPPELPDLERYHFQITGLGADTPVTFTKMVTGGQVVPEPSSCALMCLALLGVLARGRHTNCWATGSGTPPLTSHKQETLGRFPLARMRDVCQPR